MMEEDKLFLRYRCTVRFDSTVKNLTEEQRVQYDKRIDEELDVLEYHGFSSYMLIVADFIEWARRHEIAVGEGRGSVGGSLIAFLLGIHQADPIKYNLIFARFHNKEKSSVFQILIRTLLRQVVRRFRTISDRNMVQTMWLTYLT